MTTTMQRRCGYVSCSILAATACAGAARADAPPPGGGALAQERSGQPPAGKPASDERGLRVESLPLELEIGLELHGPRIGTLIDGDIIVNGDRIRVSIRTSEDAHLYLAYCDAKRELVLFPSHDSIRTRAGEVTIAPPAGADLVVDDNTGAEVLYVILSRAELSSADKRVADALKATHPGGAAAACKEGFPKATPTPGPAIGSPSSTAGRHASPRKEQRSEESGSSAPRQQPPADGARNPTRGMPLPQPRLPRRGTGHAPTTRPEADGASGPSGPLLNGSQGVGGPPLVTIERGMHISQNNALARVTAHADANGIAILRYRFQHVAAAPVPAPAPASGAELPPRR